MTTRCVASNYSQLLHLALNYLNLHQLRQLQNFDGAALVIATTNKTFLLQRGDVLVDRRQRGQLHALADFLEAPRIARLSLERHQIVENFLLSLGEDHGSNIACRPPYSAPLAPPFASK